MCQTVGWATTYGCPVKRWNRPLELATNWLEPEANPSGVVYGVLAIGTLIAAEGSRHETYASVISASLLALVLYWLAHAYARYFGSRLEEPSEKGVQWIGPAMLREAAMLKGASLPVVAMLLTWLARAPLSTGVVSALCTAGVELFVLELLAGLGRHLSVREITLEVAIGAVLGGGVFSIRLLLS